HRPSWQAQPFPYTTLFRSRGYIALNAAEPLKGKYGLSDYYVIEAQCYPGNSGSPVWVCYDFYPDPPGQYRGDKKVFLLGTLSAGDRKSTRLNSSHLVISYA